MSRLIGAVLNNASGILGGAQNFSVFTSSRLTSWVFLFLSHEKSNHHIRSHHLLIHHRRCYKALELIHSVINKTYQTNI